MNETLNCPNCGAPKAYSNQSSCLYCGSALRGTYIYYDEEYESLYADNVEIDRVYTRLRNERLMQNLYEDAIKAMRGYGNGSCTDATINTLNLMV